MTGPAWWEGLAAVEATGPPGAERHRLEWRDGLLALGSHPDPDAEVAMGALGGEVCPCLDLLEAWNDHHATGSILVVGARAVDEVLPAPTAAVDALAGDLARWRGAFASLVADARAAGDGDVLHRLGALRAPEEAAARRRLGGLLLLSLDHRLQHRLQGSVAAALAERCRPALAASLAPAAALGPAPPASAARSALAALTAATAARALPPLRRLGWTGTLAGITLGDEPTLTPTHAVLPPTWVAAVWGRNLAEAAPGHLVLDVTHVTPRGAIDARAAAIGKPRVVIRVDQWEND